MTTHFNQDKKLNICFLISPLFRERGTGPAHDMMKNILLVRGKHLQMMVAYSIIKEDEATLHGSVVKLFRSFNNDYSAFLLGILVHN